MQPRSKSAIWANDDSIPEAAKVASRKPGKTGLARPVKLSDTDEEDDAEFQDLTEVAAAGDVSSSKAKKAVPNGKAAGYSLPWINC